MSKPDLEDRRRQETALTRRALDAQVRLLPYALGFFGICLPIFLGVAAYAPNAVWLGACLGLYAVNWALFYGVTDWLKRAPEGGRPVGLRLKVQAAAALSWAAALVVTSAFASGAGPLAEVLLVLCAGAAAGVIFFSAPVPPILLLAIPAAAAGPVAALYARPSSEGLPELVLAGLCLSAALALILNRHLRGHFRLDLDRELLLVDRDSALKQAERLAKSKSDIVATLSHEIRNGLSGVAAVLAGALGAGSRGAPSREQLKAALHAARDLVEVLDATLDSETAEAGRLQVARRPVDPSRLAQDMVLLHRPSAAAKGLEILAQVDASLGAGAAIGDGARVRQILNNLVGNAVKYTLRGRIEVRVLRASAGRVRFEVVDSGPGLTAAELGAAFEPFQRVGRTGAGVPGAGLGLSLSRRLAALMDGEVAAESAPGVGSRFWLDLPFDPDADASDLGPATPTAPGEARSLRVLVAEDDALNAAMLRAVLEQLGHRVLHVGDGARALELLKVGEIDLVMLDGRMPGMDGPATARALRALDAPTSRAPIIAVTGGDAEESQAMLDAGCDTVLRKPVSVAAVARAVADAAERHPARDAA